MEKLFQIMSSTPHVFKDVEFVRDTRVPIIRSIHSPFNIEIDVTLHNVFVRISFSFYPRLFTSDSGNGKHSSTEGLFEN